MPEKPVDVVHDELVDMQRVSVGLLEGLAFEGAGAVCGGAAAASAGTSTVLEGHSGVTKSDKRATQRHVSALAKDRAKSSCTLASERARADD